MLNRTETGSGGRQEKDRDRGKASGSSASVRCFGAGSEQQLRHVSPSTIAPGHPEACKNRPVTHRSRPCELCTRECPFNNAHEDSKCVLKPMIEHRAIKHAIKIYPENYSSPKAHPYPTLHLNFFLNSNLGLYWTSK